MADRFFRFGSFDSPDDLAAALIDDPALLGDVRAESLDLDLQTSCPELVSELTNSGDHTVLGQAEIAGELVEIVELPSDNETLIVAVRTCTEVDRLPLPAS